MSYENTAGLGVNNHYGPRASAATAGGNAGNDIKRTSAYTIEDGFEVTGYVPANAIITGYHTFDLTGAVTAATVGGVSVTGASTTAVFASGELVVTGITAGKVLVEYLLLGDNAV